MLQCKKLKDMRNSNVKAEDWDLFQIEILEVQTKTVVFTFFFSIKIATNNVGRSNKGEVSFICGL